VALSSQLGPNVVKTDLTRSRVLKEKRAGARLQIKDLGTKRKFIRVGAAFGRAGRFRAFLV